MPPPLSAGILLFRQGDEGVQVLLIKPGGPFWRNKDAGAWMIPKGMVEKGEAPLEAALREFAEETGTFLTKVPFPLATVRQAGGKLVQAFAVEGNLDPAAIRSNDFELEWPPRSGTLEGDHVVECAWIPIEEIERRIEVRVVREPLLAYLRGESSGYAGYPEAGITVEFPD